MALNAPININLSTSVENKITMTFDPPPPVIINKSSDGVAAAFGGGAKAKGTSSLDASNGGSLSWIFWPESTKMTAAHWRSRQGRYNSAGGSGGATSEVDIGGTKTYYSGEWVSLEYNSTVSINSFTVGIHSASGTNSVSRGAPKQMIILYGDDANNLTGYTEKFNYTLTQWRADYNGVEETRTLASTITAKYFRMVVLQVQIATEQKQAVIGWLMLGEVPPDPSAYKIEKSTDNSTFSTLTNTLATHAAGYEDAFSWLRNTIYYYNLSSSSDGITFGNPTTVGIVTKLNNPTNIQGAPVNKKINLTWDGMGLKYDIDRKDSGAYSSIVSNITEKSYSNSGLTNGTAYTYKIKGKDKVIYVTPTRDGNELSWPDIKDRGSNNYVLERSSDSGSTWNNITLSYPDTDTEMTLSGTDVHQSGRIYRITTIVEVTSDQTESAAFTPVHPGYFTGSFTTEVIDTEKNKVKLTSVNINATSINKDDFEVKVGSSTKTINSAAISNNIITLTLSANITEADGDIQFKYTKHPSDDDRRIYNTVDNKHLNDIAFTQVTNKILPGQVTGVNPTILNKRVKLVWTATPGANKYNIYQKKGTDAWKKIASNIKHTKFTANRLENGVSYKYKISAVKTGVTGEGPDSADTASQTPTANLGFSRIFGNLNDASNSAKKQKIDKLKDFKGTVQTDKISISGRVKKEDIDTDVITAQKDLIKNETDPIKKRQIRNEAIKLLFDGNTDISSIELTTEDLDITDTNFKKTDLVVFKPAADRTIITLDIEEYNKEAISETKGFYIPLEDGEFVLLRFAGDKYVYFDRLDDGATEKIFITGGGSSTFTNVSRSAFDITSSVENFVTPEDTITINGNKIVIGSIGDGSELPSGEVYIRPDPGRKKHKKLAEGYVLHPSSVTNSYFMSGNFGGYLSNRKTDTLSDGTGKKKTSYTDYKLGTTPTAPHQKWSQPVRPILGSGDRLARLKAKAIKKSN